MYLAHAFPIAKGTCKDTNFPRKNAPVMYLNTDYISLTDMIKSEEGEDHIRNWMRNKNTIEFLGIWETLYNSNFKGVEFDTFLNEAGFNRFNMTPLKSKLPHPHRCHQKQNFAKLASDNPKLTTVL